MWTMIKKLKSHLHKIANNKACNTVLIAWQVFQELIRHALLLENHKCQTPYEYQKHVVGPSVLLNKVPDKMISLYLVCAVGCDDICGIQNRRRDEYSNDIPMCKRSYIVTIRLCTVQKGIRWQPYSCIRNELLIITFILRRICCS